MSFIDLDLQDTLSPSLLKAAADVPGAFEAALNRGQQIIDNEATRQEGGIATAPIPRNSKGKPRWIRRGTLARSRATVATPGQRVTRWSAIHASRRFGLGYAWMPKSPAGGIVRRNNVPVDTARIVEPNVIAGMTQTLENALDLD